MTMTLGTATILSQSMMSRIIFIIKWIIQTAFQKAKRLKRKIIREKTIPISSIPEKRTKNSKMKGQEEKKESVLGAIKKYQAEDKEKPKEKKEANKEAER